jgi:SAM-dependent methyltransferase
MRERGWEVSGNDLNQEALDVARRHGLSVRSGLLEDCDYPEAHFDAVHLGDLIEHVQSPRDLLAVIRSLIRPGGLVTIVTPNAESGFARYSLALSRIIGMAWPHSEAPYHLHDFAPATIRLLVENVGMTVKSIEFGTGGSFPYVVGSSGYFDDLKKVLKKSDAYKPKWEIVKYIPSLAVVSTVLSPLWVLGAAADMMNGMGRSMTVVCQRSA